MSRLPEDWSRAPLVVAAVVCFLVAAWLFRETGTGELAAVALTVLGAILVGAVVTDWAGRNKGGD